MDDHLEKGLYRCAAQVQGSFLKIGVHLAELWHHRKNDIGHVKGDVGNQQGGKAHDVVLFQHRAHKGKQQCQRNAGDDIRVGHGNVGQGHCQCFGTAAHGVDAHCRHGAQNRCNQCCHNGDQKGVAQQRKQGVVLK